MVNGQKVVKVVTTPAEVEVIQVTPVVTGVSVHLLSLQEVMVITVVEAAGLTVSVVNGQKVV